MHPIFIAALALSGVGFPGGGGYSYANYTPNVKAATITVTSLAPAPEGGHNSVGLTVEDARSWLQVGVTTEGGSPLTTYVEDGTFNGDHHLTRLTPVTLGQPVWLSITYTPRHHYVAWIDGMAVGSAALNPRQAAHVLCAENYLGGSIEFDARDATLLAGSP